MSSEIENLKYSYDRILDIFRLHNDNYFKRVQIVMVALQAGLFIALMNRLTPIPKSCRELILPIFVAVIGLFVAYIWKVIMNKQMQYMELLKRYLRNLESRFVDLEVPLDYFIIEAAIIKPRNGKDKFKTITAKIEKEEVKKKNKGKKIPYSFAEFEWSEEKYPGKLGEEPDKIHRVGEERGGLVRIERTLSTGTICIWSIVLFWLIVIPLITKMWDVLKTLCSQVS